ncbi:MAG: hypothetical protein D6731_20150, partial [Planctomycetota bacterium]
MPQVLLASDPRALSSYLGAASLLEPRLGRARCRRLRLAAEAPPANGIALYFGEGEPRLPPPDSGAQGVRLLEVAPEDEGRLLPTDPSAEPLDVRAWGPPRELAGALEPQPWEEPPRGRLAVIYRCASTEAFARLVREHLELAQGSLRAAAIENGERLLAVEDPSWFLLERCLADSSPSAGTPATRVYRRLEGPAGPRRVYMEWGYAHPLEGWLREPAEEDALLLVEGSGRGATLRSVAFEEMGAFLDLDPARCEVLAPQPLDAVERIEVRLRLEGRGSPRDPELWVLPSDRRDRLEELLARTPEDELRNLLVAAFGSTRTPGEGAAFYVVREVLRGRAPRLLPLTGRAYAPCEGLPQLYLPCTQRVAPPLSPDRLARAFGLLPGTLTLLDARAEGGIRVTRLPEEAFRPMDSVVDFVVAEEAEAVEDWLRAAAFDDLGSFVEEDLAPTPRPPQRAKRPAEAAPGAKAPRPASKQRARREAPPP